MEIKAMMLMTMMYALLTGIHGTYSTHELMTFLVTIVADFTV